MWEGFWLTCLTLHILPCFLSRSGCVVGNSLWETILLYQSAMYRHPSGPNSMFTGRNQSSLLVTRSSRCSADTLPSGFLTIRTALIELVIGFARNATFANSDGKLPEPSSAKAKPDMPVPPTRKSWRAGTNGWYGRNRSFPIPGKLDPGSIGATEYPKSLASVPYH